MSIAVGKRNFAENFSKMMISDFPRDNFYRAKIIMNESTIQNRNISSQSYLLENAKTLKHHFQHIDDKEIMTVLDDCDGNIEIAMEILQRSAQPKPAFPLVDGRTVRKINSSQEPQKVENIRPNRIEEKKQEPILEEEVPSAMKADEVRDISEHVVNKLQTLGSMDEAKEMMAQILFDVISETEKRNQGAIKKLQLDKAILVKAFAKQRIKAQASEQKNTDLTTISSAQEQEIIKLRTINYKLGLRLQTLDTNNDEIHNFDVC